MEAGAPGNSSLLLYVAQNPDDHSFLRRAAAACAARFSILTANGFFEAVDYLHGHHQYADRQMYPMPGLILVDCLLGSFRGTDLVRCIGNKRPAEKLPVVMFGNGRELHEIAESYAAGADYYVIKPGRFEGMVRVVRCLDACLAHKPPRLKHLRTVGSRPQLARHALKDELREGLEEHRKLLAEMRRKAARLDLTMAEQKEMKKKIPFRCRRTLRRKPPEQG